MKKKVLGMTVASALALTICGGALVACGSPDPRTHNLTDEPLSASIVADYTKTAADRSGTFASGSKGYSWGNGSPFNAWWNPDNVEYDNNKMSLSISEITGTKPTVDNGNYDASDPSKGPESWTIDYYGGEERSEKYYGFGDYQVRMKPSKVTGTASTFFICTGPYDVHYDTGVKNKHDEIDIEFLGKDTTKVQFNYFADGVGGHEYMYDLGFDASEEFHNYGFRWTQDYIVWFVDEKPVFKLKASDRPTGESWPSTPGRLIMNYWSGMKEAEGWMGKFENNFAGKAEYEWVKCSATAQPDPNIDPSTEPAPGDLVVPTEGWTNIDYSGFDDWGKYNVDKENGLNISHTAVLPENYSCCGMDLTANYSWVKFKIKNNDSTDATLRIDIKDKAKGGAVQAVVSEYAGATLNTADNAINISLGAGEEAVVAAKLKNMVTNQFVVFLNSVPNPSNATGDVTISELQGIVSTDVPAVEPPVSGEGTVVDLSSLGSWAGDKYTVDNVNGASGEVTISYSYDSSNAGTHKPSGWACCGAGGVSLADAAKVTFKVENKGAQAAALKIKILKGGAASDGSDDVDAITTGSTTGTEEGSGVGDGMNINIAAGATAEITVNLDPSVGADKITIFFDSMSDLSEEERSGSVTISEFKSYAAQADESEAINVAGFWSSDDGSGNKIYTIDEDKTNGVHITAAGPVTGWKNSGVALSKSYTQVTVTIKNNHATEQAKVRIDLMGVGGGSHVESITGGNSYVYEAEANATVTLEAGEEQTYVLTVKDGVTLNGIQFYVNSMGAAESDVASATDITIKELKGVPQAPAED